MPYIIETRQPARDRILGKQWHHVDRTAVATLEEAQRAARRIMADHDQWATADADALPESGGTIGPLPDGTVIEVRPMSWREAIRESGIARRQPSYWFAVSNPTTEERTSIITAFNAA